MGPSYIGVDCFSDQKPTPLDLEILLLKVAWRKIGKGCDAIFLDTCEVGGSPS